MKTPLLLITCLLISSCGGDAAESPFANKNSKAVIPTIFAAGSISTELPEFAITFSPDGNEAYFNQTPPDRSELIIYRSIRSTSGWSAPAVASFSGEFRDVDPFITPDGNRLYFSSNRPRDQTSIDSLSTWYVQRTANGWSEPIDPGSPMNSDASDVFVSTSRDGRVLFSSRRDETGRIYETHEVDGKWEAPVALKFGSVEEAGNPLIAPAGNFVILVMRQADRGADLFFSCRGEAGWQEPRPLTGGVNSTFADFAPAINSKSETLLFTSERPGIVGPQPESVRPPGDIYEVALAEIGIECS